ncbi:MAG: hypothetical protein M0C28_41175 [Candidatus Moduliflexus flocculans]|nr:hypothetical protein [Candidatus Moduliflexus flocculans]
MIFWGFLELGLGVMGVFMLWLLANLGVLPEFSKKLAVHPDLGGDPGGGRLPARARPDRREAGRPERAANAPNAPNAPNASRRRS